MNRVSFIGLSLLATLVFACASPEPENEIAAAAESEVTSSPANARGCAIAKRYQEATLADFLPIEATDPPMPSPTGAVKAKLEVSGVGTVFVVERDWKIEFYDAEKTLLTRHHKDYPYPGSWWIGSSAKLLSCPSFVNPPPIEGGAQLACVTPTPGDLSSFTYHKANEPALANTCTATDIEQLGRYYQQHRNDPDFTVTKWKRVVTQKCASCAFSDASAPTWGPIVRNSDDQLETFNEGGCAELRTGSTECGRAFAELETCRAVACPTCSDTTEYWQCRREAGQTMGACSTVRQRMIDACGLEGFELGSCRTAMGFSKQLEVACMNGVP